MDLGTQPVAVPPPPGFRAVAGHVHSVERSSNFRRTQVANTFAQSAGHRFERLVSEGLWEHYGNAYEPSARFTFIDEDGRRLCEMDGILPAREYVIVFEVKAQHTPNAWHQIRSLYEPVALNFFQRPVVPVEVVKSYDGYTPFPEPTKILFSLAELDHWVKYFPDSSEKFGVLLWPKV